MKVFVRNWVIGLLLIYGCMPTLTTQDYVSYVVNERNGLLVEKKTNDFIYQLQYQPHEYMAIQHLKSKDTNDDGVRNKMAELAGMYYFKLTIKGLTGEGPLYHKVNKKEGYIKRLQYFTGEAQNDMYLIQNKDTMRCTLYHFDQAYPVVPYNTILLGFKPNQPIEKSKGNLNFIFKNHILGVEPLQFVVKEDDLNALPSIVL